MRATASAEATTAGGGDFFPTGWLIASYLFLAVLFFLPALLPGVQIFGTDYLAVAYMWEEFVTQRFAAGELPTWLPDVYGGAPFFANPMDTYHPITLLVRLAGLPTYMHLGWIFVAHYFLAGLGGYLLLRELGARRMPAYLAGLMYMFSGYLISFIYGGHDGRAMVATVAPLFLFALHRAIRTGGARWFVLAGVVLGSALLSFQIQSSYYMLLAGGLWGVFLLWHLDVPRRPRPLGGRLAGGVLTLLVGFSMAAVNFVPFLSYVDASPRAGEGGRGYEYATSWSMAPEEIVGLAVPERIGMLQNYWGQNPMKLHTEYAGAVALLLVISGFALIRRERYTWFFVGLAAFALTLSFGGHTPIYRLYYALLPGTDKFRAPSISFYLVTLSLAVLAGLALDRLARLRSQAEAGRAAEQREAGRTIRKVLLTGAGLLGVVVLWALGATATAPAPPVGQPTDMETLRAMRAAFNHPEYLKGIARFALFLALSLGAVWLWLHRRIATQVAGVLLAVIAVADLWVIGKRFFETAPEPAVYFAPDDVANFLRTQNGPFRAFVLFDLPQDNYLTLFGVELVGGEHGNQLHSYNEFLGAGEETYTDYHNILRYPNFMALANARYLVTTQRIDAPSLVPVFQGRVRDGRAAIVYENMAALPRAFLVPTATRVADTEAALDRMRSPDFDPTRELLLYEEPPLAAGTGASVGSGDAANPAMTGNGSGATGASGDTAPSAAVGEARIVSHEPAEVVVEVDAERPAYLFLADNYYEGWVAEIDGEATPVLRANHTFRAVAVPEGRSTVTFRFEPRSLATGLRISAATGLGLLLFGAGLVVHDRRRRDEDAHPDGRAEDAHADD